MIQKCQTDEEFEACGYGPKILELGGLNIRVRIDLLGNPLRFGIFWFNSSKIEMDLSDLGEILKALYEHNAIRKFCNKCGDYVIADKVRKKHEKNWGFMNVCYRCDPSLFDLDPTTKLNQMIREKYGEEEESGNQSKEIKE